MDAVKRASEVKCAYAEGIARMAARHKPWKGGVLLAH